MSSKYAQFRAALAIAVVAAVVVFILWAGDLFVRLRLQLNDVYFLPTPVSDQIVLVAIDDASLEQFGRTPVEWSRTVFADFVRILAAARARIVTFDILFAQATPDDVEFAAAMQAARQTQSRTRFVMPIVGVERTPDEAHAISYQETLRPTPGLAAVLDYLGFVNVFTDADNRVRRQPSLVTAGSGRGYSLSITTFLAYLRVPAAAFEQVVTVENGTLTIAGGHQLAIDANGIWRQDFFAPSQSVEGFTTVSFRDVVNGGVDPAVFDDKIVMVGLMNSVNAPDERATPLQPSMAGVEIHAHAVETLLQGITLTEQSRLSEAVTILATALVSSLIYTRLRWRGMTITALILGVVMVLCAFTLFAVRREVINLFHPLLTLIVALLLSIGWQITTETNRRRSAEHLLAVIQRQKDLLEAIVRGSPAGIVVVDRAGILTHANQAFTEAVGLEKKTLIDHPLASVIDAIGLTDEARTKLSNGLAGSEPFRAEIKHGGKTVDVSAAVLPGADRWVIAFHDVSALAELSEIKTRMIRMVSHDLKNPLASVLGFSSLLLDTPIGAGLDDKQKRMLDQIRRAANSMLQIINETLSMEQLRSGRMRKKPVQLAEQIRDAVRPFQLEAEQRHQQLTLDFESNVPPALGDSFQLTQAISNLISNAIKYTPDGGSIFVRLARAGDCVRVEVQDTGYGMSEDAQANLFQEFYRVAATEHIKGTGLGLSLVKSIVEAHGGSISVKSKLNEGSTFAIEIPMAHEDTPA